MGDSVLDRKSSTVTTEKERSIRLIRLLLKSICLWPCSSNASIVDRVLSEFSICTCFSLLLITTLSCGLALFVEERENTDLIMVHIGPFFCYIMTVMKYICLVLHVNDIRICINCMELDWNTVRSIGDHEVMLRNAKIGRIMATFLTTFMHSAVQFYSVTRCLIKNVVEVNNVNISVRELPYPFYHEILDVRFSPAYEVVLVMHSVSAFVMCGVTSVNCGLMVIFVMHACGQLKILTMCIQLSRWFLRSIGAWPLALCETTTEKFGCVILIINSCFLIGFLVLPCVLSTILVDADLDNKLRMIGPLIFFLTAVMKHYILIARNEKISECIRHVHSDWNRIRLGHEKDREIMFDNARFGRWLSIVSAVFMYSGGLFYTALMPLFSRRTDIIDNVTVKLHAFPVYRGLFDPQDSPLFEVVQFMQALAGYVIYTITISVCSLAAVFVMHACGQFQILMLKMEDLADGKDRKSANNTPEKRLGDIVKCHIRILSFITCTEELLNEICLVDVIGCTLNICFLGFNLMTCVQIGIKSYMIDWYRLPSRGALGLTLVMSMSNATIKLTAGKFMDLSLASFCSLCRWVMKPIGIWHFVYNRSSQNEKLLSTALTFMCVSMLCFVLVPSGPYVLLREKDIYVKVKLLGPIGFCLTSVVKYCFLGARGTAISRCIEHVEDDWRVVWHEDHRRMMLKNVLKSRKLITLCVLFLYTAGLSCHIIIPLSAKVKINDSFTIRPLVYPGYDQYFDSQASPAYEIVFCIHCLCSLIQYSITTSACSLAAIFATHACGQVQILTTLLDDLVDGKRSDENTTVEKRLKVIARHHVRVLSKIGSAAYEVNWYDLPGHKAFVLVMIITISHYPPKLTAGKFFELSLNTFSSAPTRNPGIIIPRACVANVVGTTGRVFQSALHTTSGSMHNRSRHPERIQQIHNVHHKNDIHYTMQLCRWILKPIGIWHFVYSHSSQNEKLFSTTLIFMCVSILCFVLVPSGPYVLREKDIYVKVKLFGPIGFCLTSAVKYCFLGARGTAIGRCIEHVEDDWRVVRHENHRKMMLKNVLISRKLTTLCVLFLYTGGLSYHTIMPLSAKIKMNDSFTIRRLVYPGYDQYFDSQASPAYEIVFCIHCLCSLIQYSITSAACSLAAIFATHACGQVQILTTLLDDLVDGKRSDENTTVEKRLKVIARHHVRVLRFTADVEEVLREICLMELVAATLIICLLEYYCMMEWKNSDTIAIVTYFILLVSLTFNILIFCYIGELLVEEYSKIGSAAYEINWYDLPGHKALVLVMIIMISHYPPKLTAGKFCDLSLNTFGVVLKTSVVYLNLLRTVTE
ncbi:uncharacterized protein LOC116843416 [Odontomachus brunneus]|uniref:uncharacterized protein LOC116843416 n=1 Tax=Odontomachus brunneus TaxID=486640 RepID=UPI0013F23E37|nr:uncharacterized protein LOC116843416 [Odontomachus brunneus]